jgi:hypothetical protein
MRDQRGTAVIELSVHFTSDEKDETSDISVRLFRPDTGNWTSDAVFEPPLDDAALAEVRAIDAVLSGERDLDLSGLPPEPAEEIRRMLAALG